MKNLLYPAAGLLGILWAILYFGYHINGSVHFLLVVAFFILLLRLFNNKKLARDLNFHTHHHSPHVFDKTVEPVKNMISHGIKRQ
jgi:hypothetical protein